MWERRVRLMLYVFKNILLLNVQRILFHVSAGKWLWLYHKLLISQVPWSSAEIMTNRTSLTKWWFSFSSYTSIIKHFEFLSAEDALMYKDTLSMFIYDSFPEGDWGSAASLTVMLCFLCYQRLFEVFSAHTLKSSSCRVRLSSVRVWTHLLPSVIRLHSNCFPFLNLIFCQL